MTDQRKDAGAPVVAPDISPAGDGAADADPVVSAIDGLCTSLAENIEEERELSVQLHELTRRHAHGRSWRELVGKEDAAAIFPLLGAVSTRVAAAGKLLRRALAVALLSEGESLHDVAQRFGVSRQRIFALVRRQRPEPTPLP